MNYCFGEQELEELRFLMERAISEDGEDITSQALISCEASASGTVICKEPCRISGLPAASEISRRFNLSFSPLVQEGCDLPGGVQVAEISGNARLLLGAERTVLNFLSRLSAVATSTQRYVQSFSPVDIYDTRKTTPGWRFLEKYAVRVGGGKNHRKGLYDQFLVKDNHFALTGEGVERGSPVKEILEKARRYRPGMKLEVEAESFSQVREAVLGGADIVMLDNWSPKSAGEAIKWIRNNAPGKVEVELSGGITCEQAPEFVTAGPDRISVGAITQAPGTCDFSLELNVM